VLSLSRLTFQNLNDDDLLVLPPESVQRDANGHDHNEDAHQINDYLITSAPHFSPFEQDLGPPPFQDLHGEAVWPALAYTADGGVHPGKVSSINQVLTI
jgi:hypothetical protein